jgi:hypothetical protein
MAGVAVVAVSIVGHRMSYSRPGRRCRSPSERLEGLPVQAVTRTSTPERSSPRVAVQPLGQQPERVERVVRGRSGTTGEPVGRGSSARPLVAVGLGGRAGRQRRAERRPREPGRLVERGVRGEQRAEGQRVERTEDRAVREQCGPRTPVACRRGLAVEEEGERSPLAAGGILATTAQGEAGADASLDRPPLAWAGPPASSFSPGASDAGDRDRATR